MMEDLNYIMRIRLLAIMVKQQDVQLVEQLELVEMDVTILVQQVVVD
jgi:hypothetical protein